MKVRDGAAVDRERAINACVGANRGEAVIVLISVGGYRQFIGASCPHSLGSCMGAA